MQQSMPSSARSDKFVVTSIAIVFVLVTALLGALVAQSIYTITATSNAIDDIRAKHAAVGAKESLRKQLGAIVRDNAYWDDAFRQISMAETKRDWIIENWASTTADYPLYDTAIVVDGQNTPIVAYRLGEAMDMSPAEFLGPAFDEMVSAARKAQITDPVPVYFIRSAAGVALIGAASIRPNAPDDPVNSQNYHVLVFAKHLTFAVVSEVSETFSLANLTLDRDRMANALSIPLRDISERDVGYFNWPSQMPGTTSYLKVKNTIGIAAIILVLFLCAICAVGLLTTRRLRGSEARARFKATHDALTGLFNRSGLIERMSEASRASRPQAAAMRLHFIDLDGFKGVNDAWGHGVGDDLLVAVARRLSDMLPCNVLVARFGGDEFAVATVEPIATAVVQTIGQQIQVALERVFEIDGRTIEIGASVGVAVAATAALDVGDLIRRADIALYRAKDLGRGITVEFEEGFDEDAKTQAELEHQLRETLANDGIDVAYQPLVHADSGEICGVEALARWRTLDGRNLGPDIFIPLAEKAGLIDVLGMQVLTKALQEAKHWPGIALAVNVSPLQLKNPKFVQNVTEALRNAEFEAARFTIEITEGVLISDPDQAQRAITALKQVGIKIALDDFGSGFASIGALRQFGFDRMKIDRSLVQALDNDENGGAVLQATIALANALQIPVTAEGIETEEQAIAVRISGCDELQGYLFSKPITAEELGIYYFGKVAVDVLEVLDMYNRQVKQAI
ncbi:putative bifunctional diguanylate cyclase/phosphodiesterase [Rhizobium sp. PP-CC-3G-465]|uniref:putative bifunctional diguanylate cyclase/phosphodiesterase n=1 Tax=Rhizobium sp. PP-CC-3G-465 TaxID=2135648 RepID=UPI00104840BD|nr:periplasmic sensor diguanylate cyclase/phosphodiesterase [Rhizobium sp. PP-CC-3G-465]